jgi:hypothetical protein
MLLVAFICSGRYSLQGLSYDNLLSMTTRLWAGQPRNWAFSPMGHKFLFSLLFGVTVRAGIFSSGRSRNLCELEIYRVPLHFTSPSTGNTQH